MKKQAGFTLVEIAIVLVIIGLLLGGVLKGQEIITNAKIKNLENDFQGVTAAIYSYQDRYRALPGDDKRAHKRFAGLNSSNHVGDGDGKITGKFNEKVANGIDAGSSGGTGEESYLFWLHLRSAGLIDGEPLDEDGKIYLPTNAFNGVTGVSSEQVDKRTISSIYVGFSKIPVKVAIIIESRSDDESPNKGSIQTDITATDYTANAINSKDELDMYFAL